MDKFNKRESKQTNKFNPAIEKQTELEQKSVFRSVLVDRSRCSINGPPPGKCRS